MFRHFISKRFKVKSIKRVNHIKGQLKANGAYRCINSMEQVAKSLDDKKLLLDKPQRKFISQALDTIETHSEPKYEMLIQNKCNQIVRCIEQRYITSDTEYDKDTEELNIIVGDMHQTSSDIASVTTKMDAALGRDETTWLVLDQEKQLLETHFRSLNTRFGVLMNAMDTKAKAKEMDDLVKQVDDIVARLQYIDPDVVERNVAAVNHASETVSNAHDRVSKAVNSSLGLESSSSRYQQALAAKNLEVGTRKVHALAEKAGA